MPFLRIRQNQDKKLITRIHPEPQHISGTRAEMFFAAPGPGRKIYTGIKFCSKYQFFIGKISLLKLFTMIAAII
jgi:hypothetical protein